jgi:hypothetical protein
VRGKALARVSEFHQRHLETRSNLSTHSSNLSTHRCSQKIRIENEIQTERERQRDRRRDGRDKGETDGGTEGPEKEKGIKGRGEGETMDERPG